MTCKFWKLNRKSSFDNDHEWTAFWNRTFWRIRKESDEEKEKEEKGEKEENEGDCFGGTENGRINNTEDEQATEKYKVKEGELVFIY